MRGTIPQAGAPMLQLFASCKLRSWGIILAWRVGRAVEGTSLENWRGEILREFESHTLRISCYEDGVLLSPLLSVSTVDRERSILLATWCAALS
jgi:hypothetical protein